VTNPATGLGDNPVATGIHFEPGMWLKVPGSKTPERGDTVVRMASIPHGTTIHAQGAVPARASSGQSGGSSVKLVFDDKTNVANSKPFFTSKALPAAGQIVADKDRFQSNVFPSLDATKVSNRRVPDDLTPYNETKDGKGTITSAIIQNPNLVLGKALEKLEITDFIQFDVSTGPQSSNASCGGTSNITFLQGDPVKAGTNNPADVQATGTGANAHAVSMSSTFWIETVSYTVRVPAITLAKGTNKLPTVLLRPQMDPKSTAPTPQFAITPQVKLNPNTVVKIPEQPVKVLGTQIQYSQTVNLNFANLTWPHISVATLVPSNPQPFSPKMQVSS
jgi:hypothetical protein